LTGFPNYRFDTRVARDFRVTERLKVQVLGEAFNLFNHSNFTGYNTTAFNVPKASAATQASASVPIKLTSATGFAVPSQDGGQPDGTGARRFQLGVKLNF
jgi:hypothetical protein